MNTNRRLGNMSKTEIVGDYQTALLQHYDGSTREIYYTDKETLFPNPNDKIISITDPEGYITQVNAVFVQMSGYSKEELMGAPHHILRHPDMPKAAFKMVWDALAESGRWQGYVKNLRKDGGFYWVFASIFELHRDGKLVGYTSSRSAAPRDKVEECTKLYAELLAQETA